MLTTRFVPGAPNWLDLGVPGVPGVDAAAAFYSALFSWTFQSAGPEYGGYGFFQLGGKTVAAVGPYQGRARARPGRRTSSPRTRTPSARWWSRRQWPGPDRADGPRRSLRG